VYQSFYNLTGKPFRLSPDPTFFFPSRGHKRALAYLRYGLHQNEGFVVITGAPGTGKTMLAQILLNELGEKNIVVAHLTTTQLEADDMLRMVAASFGLRYENLDKAALLKSIESFLLTRSRENKRALLVVDEAQNLPARSLEELRMLSNLQVGDKALLQTFLLGQAQFRNMLELPDLEQLRQRVIANFHLGPLAADESQRYIESRLRHVDWDNDPVFAELAFEKIHYYTEGVPRRINMLCDRILLFGCMEEQHTITGEIVDAVRNELEQEVATDQVQILKDDEEMEQARDADTRANKMNAKAMPQSSSPKQQTAYSPAPAKPERKAQAPAVQDAAVAVSEPEISSRGQRIEPSLPISFDDDDQYIDIGQEFIDAFEKSISISEDDSEDKAKTFINSKASVKATAKTRAKPAEEPKAQKSENAQEKLQEKHQPPAESTTEDDVQGNTVKHKKPVEVTADEDKPVKVAATEAPQISERDLFHVIPGGKDDTKTKEAPRETTKVAKIAIAPSNEDVMLRRILRLVLAFHRSPTSFPGLDDPAHPLPEGVGELLELAVADDQVLTKVSPAAVMGISPVMLRAAVRFFICRTLFANENDNYRMLGLTNEASVADIERHYDLLMRLLRQDKQPGAAERVDRIGKAYEALMRFDDVEEFKQSPKDVKSVERAASVLEALESPELTIDFSDESSMQPPPQPKPLASFVGAGHENYIPDPRITRRRMHLLGQAAILGIGALVVVLGIFITQLEPDSKDSKDTPVQVSNNNQLNGAAIAPPASQAASETGTENTPTSSGDHATIADVGDSSEPKATFAKPEPEQPHKTVVAKVTTNRLPEKPAPHKATPAPIKPVAVPVTKDIAVQQPKKEFAAVDKPVEKFTPVPVASKESIQVSSSAGASAQSATSSSVMPVIPVNPRNSTLSSAVPKASTAPSKPAPNVALNNRFQGKDIPIAEPNTAPQPSGTLVTPIGTTGTVPDTSTTDNASTTQVAIADTGLSANSDAISGEQLKHLLDDFSNAYDTGNLNKLMSLFADDARTNSQTSRNGIEADYRQMFSTTASRNMTLISPDWSNEGRFARGVGQYSINVVPQGGQPSMAKGKYTIQVYLDGNQVKISRFYFSNDLASIRGSSPGNLSLSEVNALLANFAKDYEAGDINNLMKLFANNAQTTDQTTLSGIRKDHVDLFNATTARQIFLKDIVWDTSAKVAVGKGNFEVLVKSKGQTEFASVTGTIKIEAVKTSSGPKILKFIHKTAGQ